MYDVTLRELSFLTCYPSLDSFLNWASAHKTEGLNSFYEFLSVSVSEVYRFKRQPKKYL